MRRESDLTGDCLTLGLLAKYWEPGRVKTRLGKSIGMARAAEIHRVFVAYICEALRGAADRRVVSLSPIDRRSEVQAMLDQTRAKAAWSFTDQGAGDLGARMQRWFTRALAGKKSRAILLGADCPTIRPELISATDQLLQDNDLVIGPACDGGYYLIGLRGHWQDSRFEPLFRQIPWSTPSVLEITRSRANAAGLAYSELEPAEDVDTIAELNNLLARLEDFDAELRIAIERVLADSTLVDPA